jgi:hypothetical protein
VQPVGHARPRTGASRAPGIPSRTGKASSKRRRAGATRPRCPPCVRGSNGGTASRRRLLEAADAGEARHVLYQHLRPAVRRNGRVVYGVADGGLVCDQQVRVNQVTAGAAFLALTLAADRFGNRPLNVQGTDDFRKQVAELSGIEGLGVSFADAGLERQRQRATVARANRIDREAGVFIRSNVSDDRDRSR